MDQNDDLIKLQNYLSNKYNIDVKIKILDKTVKNETIVNIYIKAFIVLTLFILFIIFIYFLSSNKKFNNIKKKYLILNIIFYILLIIIFLLIIYYLQKYLFMIYFYYKNYKKIYKNNFTDLNDINFNTGDILQEVPNWSSPFGIIIYLFKLDFLHNIFIFKFNNKNYVLHFFNGNVEYPKNTLTFKSKYLQITRLDDYLKDNYFYTEYYRLFKYNKKLEPDKIFSFLKNLNMENLRFTFSPCIKDCDNDRYNCMSFILKLLNSLNIIPKFNIDNFTPNDLIYLKNISHGSYDDPFIVKF